MTERIARAVNLATRAHEGQTRKYGGNPPYIVHPTRVAITAAMMYQGDNKEDVICAALLHDVLEDTECPPTVIEERCGDAVLRLVQELTNASKSPEHASKPRAIRKQIDRDHLKTASPEAKFLKLCDRLDNLRDMAMAPGGFRKLYNQESLELLEVLKGVHPELERQMGELLNSGNG